MRRNHEYRNRRPATLNFSRKGQTVHSGHSVIEQHQINHRMRIEKLQGVFAIQSAEHGVALEFQNLFSRVEDYGFVIYRKDEPRTFSRPYCGVLGWEQLRVHAATPLCHDWPNGCVITLSLKECCCLSDTRP